MWAACSIMCYQLLHSSTEAMLKNLTVVDRGNAKESDSSGLPKTASSSASNDQLFVSIVEQALEGIRGGS